MQHLFRLGMLIAVATLLSLPVWAESATDDEPDVTVIVTAERTEQPVSESIATTTVVTAKEIRELCAQSAADVLRTVPGVSVRQYGGFGALAHASFRGTDVKQMLVLVDGQRVSSTAFLGVDFSKFPIDTIARIEVMRGPASSLYGSEAIGGVINIITKKATSDDTSIGLRPMAISGDSSFAMGTDGLAKRSVALRGDAGILAWQLNGSFPESDGARPNSDYSADDFSASFQLPSIYGWSLSLRGDDYSDALGLPGDTTYPSLKDRQWWDRSNVNLAAARDLAGGKFVMQGSWIRQKYINKNPDWGTDSLITGVSQIAEATYNREFNGHTAIFGGEFRQENYRDIESGVQAQDKDITNRALFLQDRWNVADKTDLVLGARLDDHSAAGSKLTPRMGVTYALNPATHLRASYAGGFRAPSLVELYYQNAAWNTYGNPDLRPESSSQYEVGANFSRSGDSLDISIFNNNVRDMIAYAMVDANDPENMYDDAYSYKNINKARQRGAEVAWSHKFAPQSSLNLSYSFLLAHDRTTGARLLRIPHHQLTATVTRRVKWVDIALTGMYTGSRLDINSSTLPSRVIFDVTLEKNGSGLVKPYLVVRNLADTDYEYLKGYPAEGRTYEVGVRSSW